MTITRLFTCTTFGNHGFDTCKRKEGMWSQATDQIVQRNDWTQSMLLASNKVLLVWYHSVQQEEWKPREWFCNKLSLLNCAQPSLGLAILWSIDTCNIHSLSNSLLYVQMIEDLHQIVQLLCATSHKIIQDILHGRHIPVSVIPT